MKNLVFNIRHKDSALAAAHTNFGQFNEASTLILLHIDIESFGLNLYLLAGQLLLI